MSMYLKNLQHVLCKQGLLHHNTGVLRTASSISTRHGIQQLNKVPFVTRMQPLMQQPNNRWFSSGKQDDKDEWEWVPPVSKGNVVGDDDAEVEEEEFTERVAMSPEELKQLESWTAEELSTEVIESIPVVEGEDVTVEEVVAVLKGNAAVNVVSIDVSEKVDYLEHMVVATGRSTLHMKKLAKIVYQGLKARGQNTMVPESPIEGFDSEDWMLLDLGYMMINIMSEQGRDYYKIENYWEREIDLDQERYARGEPGVDEALEESVLAGDEFFTEQEIAELDALGFLIDDEEDEIRLSEEEEMEDVEESTSDKTEK